jgi:hypothetical protein
MTATPLGLKKAVNEELERWLAGVGVTRAESG